VAELIRDRIVEYAAMSSDVVVSFGAYGIEKRPHSLLDVRVARLFGMLAKIAQTGNDELVMAVVKGLARERWECEERLGIEKFGAMAASGKDADASDIGMLVGPPLPGDGLKGGKSR
jgi:hypothetical protein